LAAVVPRRRLLEFFFLGGIVVLFGWHHIVAAWSGCPLDTPLRAVDVPVKTGDAWLSSILSGRRGRFRAPACARPAGGGNQGTFGK
jgi:hypothetical protein